MRENGQAVLPFLLCQLLLDSPLQVRRSSYYASLNDEMRSDLSVIFCSIGGNKIQILTDTIASPCLEYGLW